MTSTQHERTARSPADMIGQITGKFATVPPEEFRQTMELQYRSAQAITETVADEVEAGRISTVQGAAVVASVTGSLFGWPEFHRELRPSDLALGLLRSGNGSR